MPLVLMQHSPGLTKYDDDTGQQYHYPRQYFKRIRTGEKFVYCRPKEPIGDRAKTTKTVYFGTGVIGAIKDDLTRDGHRYCQIVDYLEFPAEVPYNDENGVYLETGIGGIRGIPMMQNAVRVIDETALHRILEKSGLDRTEKLVLQGAKDNEAQQVKNLNKLYQDATPGEKRRLARVIERGSAIGGRVKALNNYVCQTCGTQPFITRSGQPYAEAHHVIPLERREPGSLASHNVLCLCATCHRKMHYGNVELVQSDANRIVFEIEGKTVEVRRNNL